MQNKTYVIIAGAVMAVTAVATAAYFYFNKEDSAPAILSPAVETEPTTDTPDALVDVTPSKQADTEIQETENSEPTEYAKWIPMFDPFRASFGEMSTEEFPANHSQFTSQMANLLHQAWGVVDFKSRDQRNKFKRSIAFKSELVKAMFENSINQFTKYIKENPTVTPESLEILTIFGILPIPREWKPD